MKPYLIEGKPAADLIKQNQKCKSKKSKCNRDAERAGELSVRNDWMEGRVGKADEGRQTKKEAGIPSLASDL